MATSQTALIRIYADSISLFFESRKSKYTASGYRTALRCIFSVDDSMLDSRLAEFMSAASFDRASAETFLMHWIVSYKKHPSATREYISALKSLCDMCDVQINWKKIKSICPKPPRTEKIATPIDATRKIYSSSDIRGKFMISLLASTGGRIGLFDYACVRDVEKITVLGVEIGRIKIYPGEPERYFSYLTPEALHDFEVYIALRKNAGENVTPASPLLRNHFDPQCPRVMKRINSRSATDVLEKKWKDSGFKERNWSPAHGFRSFAETALCSSGMKWEDAELILGHRLRYYKATDEHLASEFVRCMHGLYISEEPKLKEEVKRKDRELDSLGEELRYIRQDLQREIEGLKRKIGQN